MNLGGDPRREGRIKVRLIKMLGLAAVAAIAAMAFVGASSAVAGSTDLCTEHPNAENKCPAGTSLALVKDGIHYVDPLALLRAVGAFGVTKDILCEALFLGEALDLAAPLVIHGEFKYGKPHGISSLPEGLCFEMEKKENCGEIKEVGPLGGLLLVLRTSHELATVVGHDFEVLVKCGGLHCVYNAAGLEGHALGPLLSELPNGAVTIVNQTVNKVEGFLCPETASLTTTQKPLKPNYIGV